MPEISRIIADLRRAFPISDIEKMLGIHRSRLSCLMEGSSTPSHEEIARSAEVFRALAEHFVDDLRIAFKVWRSQDRNGASLQEMFAKSPLPRSGIAAHMRVLESSIVSLKAAEARRVLRPFKATGRNGFLDEGPSAAFSRD